jgi:hypothetical protein
MELQRLTGVTSSKPHEKTGHERPVLIKRKYVRLVQPPKREARTDFFFGASFPRLSTTTIV